MATTQDTCARGVPETRRDRLLCDECHKAPGVRFVQGQWLCMICRTLALRDIYLEPSK